MKAAKLRNHPIPTHQHLVEVQEEKMERLEDDVPAYSEVEVSDLEPIEEDDAAVQPSPEQS